MSDSGQERTISDQELDEILNSYTWMKVPEHQEQPELPWEQRYKNLYDHHELEIAFFIDKVRSLAKRVHELENK